jgi:general secretion pathway protein G
MKRSGFTMIELIFVIVILGILASVAIPKLAATRDDAKVAAVAQQVQSAISEIPAYVTAKGKVDSMINMSQVLAQLNEQGKLSKTSGSYTAADKVTNETDVFLGTLDNTGSMEDCFEFKVDANATTLQVIHGSGTGKICSGVQARIQEGNYTIGGQSVVF